MTKKRVVKSPVKFEKQKPDIDPKTDPMQFPHPTGPGAPVAPEVGSSFKDYLNVFEFECILPNSGKTVRFKPLTIGTIKKMLTMDINEDDPKQASESFNKIFEHCVVGNFDPGALILADRFFLLVEIRKQSQGAANEYQITCPKCKSQSHININLDELQIVEPNMPYDEIELTPQLSITMRHITHRDELEVYDIWDKIKNDVPKEQRQMELSSLMEAQCIDKIITPKGEENVQLWDKKYLLDQLPPSLFEKVMEWHTDNYHGYDFNYKIKCIHCSHEQPVELTKSDFFQ